MKILEKFLFEELKLPDESVYSLMQKFNVFNHILLDWNSKINLISRQNLSIESHVLNSIFFLTKYKLKKDAVIADIGTGGGFPGIPLKLIYNELDLLLVDSVAKKIKVLEDITEKMELKDTDAISERAEILSIDKLFRKKFNYVTSKAVAPLDKLYAWTENFLKSDGACICIKGGDIDEEVVELKKKFKNIETNIIEYSFPEIYNIVDKKIVVITKNVS
ncbi:16S rRNA (guanine(527)-N(7))-methyltransferase RsmG [soil metagenome]